MRKRVVCVCVCVCVRVEGNRSHKPVGLQFRTRLRTRFCEPASRRFLNPGPSGQTQKNHLNVMRPRRLPGPEVLAGWNFLKLFDARSFIIRVLGCAKGSLLLHIILPAKRASQVPPTDSPTADPTEQTILVAYATSTDSL